MKKFGSRLALHLGAVAVLACLFTQRGETQDVSLRPTYGTVNLRAGFVPDPFFQNVAAGGPIQTNLGGVNAWVARAPDFRLNYTRGNFALTFMADSGRAFFLLALALFSTMPGETPFLAACCGFAVSLVFMKN